MGRYADGKFLLADMSKFLWLRANRSENSQEESKMLTLPLDLSSLTNGQTSRGHMTILHLESHLLILGFQAMFLDGLSGLTAQGVHFQRGLSSCQNANTAEGGCAPVCWRVLQRENTVPMPGDGLDSADSGQETAFCTIQ